MVQQTAAMGQIYRVPQNVFLF